MPNSAPSDLLTLKEASQQLRVSTSTVLRLAHGQFPNQPKLPSVRFGRRIMFRRESLAQYIEQAEEK